ncbi:MAG: iron-containing alcohol dehydrogenase [Thermodesulfobacteriota bacterium]
MLHALNSFECRTRLLFGRGAAARLGDVAGEMGARRYLLVADPALASVGVLGPVRASLDAAGLQGAVFEDVEPEPYLDGADRAGAQGHAVDADLVIGIGGGSAMDTAKAAAMLLTNEGKAQDYIGLNLVNVPGVPTLMVPTTAGTGAEVTFTAVFTNRETKAKGGINSPFLFPNVAVLDPELTVPLPANVTAYTGMDALTHAIESVSSRSSTVFTEALGTCAVRLIFGNAKKAVADGTDLDARERMLMGSVLAGMALADAGVGACHALAYPLGGRYRIPHGLANAVLLPYVMDFNVEAASLSYSLLAGSMGPQFGILTPDEAAASAVEAVRDLCRAIGIPRTLAELNVPRSDIPAMVESALTVRRPVENNPRTLGEKEATSIYERAFGA